LGLFSVQTTEKRLQQPKYFCVGKIGIHKKPTILSKPDRKNRRKSFFKTIDRAKNLFIVIFIGSLNIKQNNIGEPNITLI
jgi:hypothetical protein